MFANESPPAPSQQRASASPPSPPRQKRNSTGAVFMHAQRDSIYQARQIRSDDTETLRLPGMPRLPSLPSAAETSPGTLSSRCRVLGGRPVGRSASAAGRSDGAPSEADTLVTSLATGSIPNDCGACAHWRVQCTELEKRCERLKAEILQTRKELGEERLNHTRSQARVARLQQDKHHLEFLFETVRGARASHAPASKLSAIIADAQCKAALLKEQDQRSLETEFSQEAALDQKIQALVADKRALERKAELPLGQLAKEIAAKELELHQASQQRHDLEAQHARQRAERQANAARLDLQVALLVAEQSQRDFQAIVEDGRAEAMENPVMWGITMHQLQNFYDEIDDGLESYCARHWHLRKRGLDGDKHIHVCSETNCKDNHFDQDFQRDIDVEESQYVDTLEPNMHVVVQREVKPRTQDLNCSLALKWNPHGRTANIFVSHSWNERFQEFVHTLRNALDINQDVVWICSFALNQNGHIASTLAVNLIETPFAVALKHASKVVVALESQISAPSRAWCTYELALARQWSKPVALWFYKLGLADISTLKAQVQTLDLRKAEATSEQDRLRIFEEIQKLAGGFDGLNVAIRDLLLDRLKLHETISAEHRETIENLESQLVIARGNQKDGLAAALREQLGEVQQAVAKQSAVRQNLEIAVASEGFRGEKAHVSVGKSASEPIAANIETKCARRDVRSTHPALNKSPDSNETKLVEATLSSRCWVAPPSTGEKSLDNRATKKRVEPSVSSRCRAAPRSTSNESSDNSVTKGVEHSFPGPYWAAPTPTRNASPDDRHAGGREYDSCSRCSAAPTSTEPPDISLNSAEDLGVYCTSTNAELLVEHDGNLPDRCTADGDHIHSEGDLMDFEGALSLNGTSARRRLLGALNRQRRLLWTKEKEVTEIRQRLSELQGALAKNE